MRDRLGTNPVPVQLPLGEEDKHRGVIDLVRMKAIVFDEASKGSEVRRQEIPADFKDAADGPGAAHRGRRRRGRRGG
jgi:elongation factor G